MALTLDSISTRATLRAPRMLLCGVEKIGKSEFACGSEFVDGPDGGKIRQRTGLNKPVVIPVKGEEGIDDLEVPSFPAATTFDQVMEALGVLYVEDHEHRTVVIDSVSALEPLVWDHVCAKHGHKSIEDFGYGKGYTEAAAGFRELLEALDALREKKGMASILIGHVKVKRFDDPGAESYDQFQLDLHDKASNLIRRWCDLTLFCNTKVIVQKEDTGFGGKKKRGVDVTGGQRFVYTQKRPAHPGGGRGVYGRLPYELPLSYPAFEAAVASAMNQETK